MLVKSMTEEEICEIGHAFGYYDYGEETGMSAAFSGKEATANYICAYVRGVLRGGFLHTTGERGEGYIAYKLPKEKMGLKTMWLITCEMLHNSTLKRLLRFGMKQRFRKHGHALSRIKRFSFIAHRMRTVSSADKIVVLKDGEVAEQGLPAQLLHEGGIFAHMVQLQTESQGWTLTKAEM